ncbi:MAG: DUF2007 domain-containing protein [Dehalococcoidia bacterium]|nr:MAG: DUF2007 domain-containing protein [Dehalococcoidia bacterium]UCG83195.1 MAG: DUF2007 domain-containing protein [Dehalococcoidia bacterium]
MAEKPDFVVVCTVQGELQASVLKSHLESEGIPVLLKYESAGKVFGLTVDGLGEVRIMVPQELAEQAKCIIKPRDSDAG